MCISPYKHMLISMCAYVHSCEYLYELGSMRMGRAVGNQKGELSKRKELSPQLSPGFL